MELIGRYNLQASSERIWAALSDPDVIKKCLPGCESVEKISDHEMKLVVAVSVGPFKASFTGTVKQSEPNPPTRWTLVGEGRGWPSGRAKGEIDVELKTAGEGTELSFVGAADARGKLADVADQIVREYAKDLADTFFLRLAEDVKSKDEEKWVDQLDHSPAGVLLVMSLARMLSSTRRKVLSALQKLLRQRLSPPLVES